MDMETYKMKPEDDLVYTKVHNRIIEEICDQFKIQITDRVMNEVATCIIDRITERVFDKVWYQVKDQIK